MTRYEPNIKGVPHHPAVGTVDAPTREAVLRFAEHHLTASEFSTLLADLANGVVDVRVYEDAIVLMRDYRR